MNKDVNIKFIYTPDKDVAEEITSEHIKGGRSNT